MKTPKIFKNFGILAKFLFGDPTQNSANKISLKFSFLVILKISYKYIKKWRRSRKLCKVDFRKILLYWRFCGFLEVVWHKIAKLDVIQLFIGLPHNIDPNEGQNKFEGHIIKNVAKLAISWSKIGQRYFGARFALS